MEHLHMTIDPSFTHIVLDITREKLWEKGDVKGAEQFFKDSFGFDNKQLIANIIRGKWVMVFNEDGSGNICPRKEVTEEQIKAMNGLPEYWDRSLLFSKLRKRVMWRKNDVFETLKAMQTTDFHDIRKEYVFNIGADSARLINDAVANIPDLEFDITTSISTRSLFRLFARSKNDEASKNVMEAIMNSDSKAASVLYICRDIEKEVNNYHAIMQVLSYSEMYWEADTLRFDDPKENGIPAMTHEDILNHKADEFYVWGPYQNAMNELCADYQYIFAQEVDQDMYSSKFVADQMQAEAEIKGYVDFVARQKEVSDGPVKIDERPWDAGWIAPDGKVWAENGSTANLIHINLADRIFRWMGWEGTDDDSDNRDFKLEQLGWMKFHDREISFAGYAGLRTTAKVTNRQKDRLVEYCKIKKYDDLYAPFTKKHINRSEINSMSEDEWKDIFEW